MSFVAINADLCNLCGVCVERCPNNFRKDEDKITAMARRETCAFCGHCVALCPTDAIFHEKMDMENFPELDRKLKFDPDEFDEFVRGRRSVRSFKKRRVPRVDLARLVDLCRYAPTGSNKQDVEILVIEDKERIARMSVLATDSFAALYGQPQTKTDPDESTRTLRVDPIFYHAPVVMIFHQPKRSGRTDSIIAAQTVVLAAMNLGLGTCYIGMLEHAWHSSEEVRKVVDLPDDHTIGSVLILGYPKLKYLRSVDRFPMSVRWE